MGILGNICADTLDALVEWIAGDLDVNNHICMIFRELDRFQLPGLEAAYSSASYAIPLTIDTAPPPPSLSLAYFMWMLLGPVGAYVGHFLRFHTVALMVYTGMILAGIYGSERLDVHWGSIVLVELVLYYLLNPVIYKVEKLPPWHPATKLCLHFHPVPCLYRGCKRVLRRRRISKGCRSFPELVEVTDAGTEEVNGVYRWVERGRRARSEGDTLGCVPGIYVHTTNPAIWMGFQDCGGFGHPEWNKWVINNAGGVLYAAHTGGQTDVPPPAKWEMATWAKDHTPQLGDVGEGPPPKLKKKDGNDDEFPSDDHAIVLVEMQECETEQRTGGKEDRHTPNPSTVGKPNGHHDVECNPRFQESQSSPSSLRQESSGSTIARSQPSSLLRDVSNVSHQTAAEAQGLLPTTTTRPAAAAADPRTGQKSKAKLVRGHTGTQSDDYDGIRGLVADALKDLPGWSTLDKAQMKVEDVSGHGGSATFKIIAPDSAQAKPPAVALHSRSLAVADRHVSELRMEAAAQLFVGAGLAPKRIAQGGDWFIEEWGGSKAGRHGESDKLDDTAVMNLGRLLAKVHSIPADWYEEWRSRIIQEHQAFKDIPHCSAAWWLSARASEWVAPIQEATFQQFGSVNLEFLSSSVSRQVVTCHGDFHLENIICNPEAGYKIIDFEFSGALPAIHDFQWAFMVWCHTLPQQRAFVKAYLEALEKPSQDMDVDAILLDACCYQIVFEKGFHLKSGENLQQWESDLLWMASQIHASSLQGSDSGDVRAILGPVQMKLRRERVFPRMLRRCLKAEALPGIIGLTLWLVPNVVLNTPICFTLAMLSQCCPRRLNAARVVGGICEARKPK